VYSLEQNPFVVNPAKADCRRAKVRRNPFSLAKLIVEPGFRQRMIMVKRKGTAMKLTAISCAAALMHSGAFAYAQSGVPSGRGSTTGDLRQVLRRVVE
jgi:hypothetical protein